MNKGRRSALGRAVNMLHECSSIIYSAMSDEQDYLDNMPENLQSSERAIASEESIDNLQDAYDSIGEAIDNVQSAMR